MKPSFLYHGPSNLRLTSLEYPRLLAVPPANCALMTSGEILRMLKDTYDTHLQPTRSQPQLVSTIKGTFRASRKYQSQMQSISRSDHASWSIDHPQQTKQNTELRVSRYFLLRNSSVKRIHERPLCLNLLPKLVRCYRANRKEQQYSNLSNILPPKKASMEVRQKKHRHGCKNKYQKMPTESCKADEQQTAYQRHEPCRPLESPGRFSGWHNNSKSDLNQQQPQWA